MELVPVDPVAVWGEPVEDGGFHALQRHLFDRFAESFSNSPRVLAVGPAALATDFGAIGSSKVHKGELTAVECWAGRGGLGSRMAQEHNLFGVVFGGSFLDRDLDDRKLADRYFQRRYEMRMAFKDRQSTKKYRYDPELETGGTFGVNFASLGGRVINAMWTLAPASSSTSMALSGRKRPVI